MAMMIVLLHRLMKCFQLKTALCTENQNLLQISLTTYKKGLLFFDVYKYIVYHQMRDYFFFFIQWILYACNV